MASRRSGAASRRSLRRRRWRGPLSSSDRDCPTNGRQELQPAVGPLSASTCREFHANETRSLRSGTHALPKGSKESNLPPRHGSANGCFGAFASPNPLFRSQSDLPVRRMAGFDRRPSEADRPESTHSGRPAASRSFSLKPGDCGFGRPGRTHGQPIKTSVPRYYGASDQVVFADEHRRLRIAQLGCHQVWQSPVVVLGSFLSGYWVVSCRDHRVFSADAPGRSLSPAR